MGSLIFVVKSFFITLVVLVLLQIKIGDFTLENRINNFVHTSGVIQPAQQIADGLVRFIRNTWRSATGNFKGDVGGFRICIYDVGYSRFCRILPRNGDDGDGDDENVSGDGGEDGGEQQHHGNDAREEILLVVDGGIDIGGLAEVAAQAEAQTQGLGPRRGPGRARSLASDPPLRVHR